MAFVFLCSGAASRVSPVELNSSWSILALDRDDILAGDLMFSQSG